MAENLPANPGDVDSILDQEDPLEKEMATHSSIAWESHGQRSLAGPIPWGHKVLDTTEQLTQAMLRGTEQEERLEPRPLPSGLLPLSPATPTQFSLLLGCHRQSDVFG